MDIQTSSLLGMMSQNEIMAIVLLAPVILGVYLGLRAW